jgi:uncharacterized protein YjbI with pentapeptide repeats
LVNLKTAKKVKTMADYVTVLQTKHPPIQPGADLRRADCRGALFGSANLARTNLEGTDFREAYLEAAEFSGADFTGTNFRGSNLRSAHIFGRALEKAVVEEEDIRYADLYE